MLPSRSWERRVKTTNGSIILGWIGMINLALAIGNILPIPALDGGRLVFVFLEAVRGKRVDPTKERLVHAYTLLALLGADAVHHLFGLLLPGVAEITGGIGGNVGTKIV